MPTQVQDEKALAAELIERALEAGRPALDEAAAKQVLAAYGVPVPAGGVVQSAPEAVELAATLGGPVALKATGALIQHKTEAGLVLLDLRTPDEVAAGYATLAERAGDALEGVLVEQMVAGSREFLDRHEARRGLRSRGDLRSRRDHDRGVPRHRPGDTPCRRRRCRGTPRSDQGEGAAGPVPRAEGRRPRQARRGLPGRRPPGRRAAAHRRDRREPAAHRRRLAGGRRRPHRARRRRRRRTRPPLARSCPISRPCWRRSPWPSSAPPTRS